MREQKKQNRLERKYCDARETYQDISGEERSTQGVVTRWLQMAAHGGPIALVCVSALVTMAVMATAGVRSVEPFVAVDALAAFTIVALLLKEWIHGTTVKQRAQDAAQSGTQRTSPRKTRSPPLFE